jgi:hypothetical protein
MGFTGDPTAWPQHVTVHVRKNAGLARLLAAAGPWTARTGLPAAAVPDTPNAPVAAVTVLQHHTGLVSEELAVALQRARETGDPDAAGLAAVAAQLGVHEVPVPEPAQEPPAPEEFALPGAA